ncbi:Endonuclease/exonuclease/phosphatase, partial [Trametes meyenii]
MAEMRIGVLMLQETHLTAQRVADLHRIFAGRVKVLFSVHPHAPTQKEGVAVVINRKIISAEGVKMSELIPGRAIQLSIPWCGGDVRRVLCVYAPTSDGVQERVDFYKNLTKYYQDAPGFPKPQVMTGDFNNIETALDRSPPRMAADASNEALDELKRILGLMPVDGWRSINPTEKAYTFQRGTGEARAMSRLDRIYVTESAFQWAREWRIDPVGVRTDHNMVSVLLTSPSAPELGKGRPVFPLHLLKDKKLTKRMRERGLEATAELDRIAELGRTEERNPQMVLADLKRDWLKLARDREKLTVPRLVKEIE